MKGGVYVGPLPESSKTPSKPSAIERKKKALEAKAIEDHKDPDDNKIYDDLLTEVNIANPKSFATFARGKAIALFTKENLEKLMKTSTTYNRPLQDPITRQPFTPEVLAWINNIDEEGPFALTMILPVEHTIIDIAINESYVTLIDRKGNFTIYNTSIEEVATLEEPKHNQIFVSPDGTHAVTYNYLLNSTEENIAKLWTITPDSVKGKDLKSTLRMAAKGAFTTPDKKLYLYYSGNGFLQWDFSKTRLAKGKILKQEELYRPTNTYQMDIYYTNNKLIYYNNLNHFMSYVQRNDDGTFTPICENTPYLPARYDTYDQSPITFSLDGSKMATYIRSVAKLMIFDITQSKPILLQEFSHSIQTYYVIDLAFSTDNKYVFMGYSNKIVIHDLERNKLVQTIKVGEELRRTMYSDVPKIRVAYFSDYLVVAIGTLVHLFKEEGSP